MNNNLKNMFHVMYIDVVLLYVVVSNRTSLNASIITRFSRIDVALQTVSFNRRSRAFLGIEVVYTTVRALKR